MADPHSRRLPALLVTSAAAVALTAAPALATEGPAAPAPPVPVALVLPNFAPMPAPVTTGSRPAIRSARLASRRIRRGQRARLRLSLSEPGRVRIVIQRRWKGRRISTRAFTVTARRTSLSVRLPAPPAPRSLPHHRGGHRRRGRPLPPGPPDARRPPPAR